MKEYLLKSGLFDRPRRLILSDSYIEWENSDLKGHEFTKVLKSDIIDFKYGVDAIIWYKFSVGRFNLNEEGIELGEKRKLVPWNQIAAKDYFKYFAVYNENDSDTHDRVSYNDFGAETLRSLIRYAVREG